MSIVWGQKVGVRIKGLFKLMQLHMIKIMWVILFNAHIFVMFMKCDILGFGAQVCAWCGWWCVLLVCFRVWCSRMCKSKWQCVIVHKGFYQTLQWMKMNLFLKMWVELMKLPLIWAQSLYITCHRWKVSIDNVTMMY